MDEHGQGILSDEGMGKRISDRRTAIGITQSRLAELLNTSDVMVSRWENGKFRPSGKYMKKLAESLRTTTSYLNGETENPDAIEVQTKTTMPINLGLSETEKPKGKAVDYSLKMGPSGVELERRNELCIVMKLEAPSGTELKIKALADAIWDKVSGGYKFAADTSLDRKRTEALLFVEKMDEEQLDRLNEWLNGQVGV